MILLHILGLVLLIIALDHLLFKKIQPALGPRLLRFLTAPGVAVHELSHAAACFATFAPVEEIAIWDPQGGHVTHGPSKIPFVGSVLIAMAPILGCSITLVGLSHWLLDAPPDLPSPASLGAPWPDYLRPLVEAPRALGATLIQGDFRDWHLYLFLYLGTSLALSVSPSKEDLKNCLVGMLVLGAAAGFLLLPGEQIPLPPAVSHLAGRLWTTLLLATAMMEGALLLLLLWAGFRRGFALDKAKGKSDKPKDKNGKGGKAND
jgi:hypothetical protein